MHERYIRKIVKREIRNQLYLTTQTKGFSTDDKNDKDVEENTPPQEGPAETPVEEVQKEEATTEATEEQIAPA